ncbi:hypothetical protein B7P43_G16894 [Cryptotermes secundus]|uniref:Uncharacterized protein n=1 Tax=Cryptotermes secundus TaxID=105785 RepID=A0A2J7R0B6_9NEOP|nr:hypothetical protein B7P43_G16894 [Cryptotermes secundus]
MNVNNFHYPNAAVSVPGEISSHVREVSDYHRNGGEKNVIKKTPEQLSDMFQPSVLLNKTNSSEINCCYKEQMPKISLKKIKKKRILNSRPVKGWFRGKTDGDKIEHQESSTGVSKRENCNDECPVSQHIQPITCGESVLNSSILDEVLSEKKRVIPLIFQESMSK